MGSSYLGVLAGTHINNSMGPKLGTLKFNNLELPYQKDICYEETTSGKIKIGKQLWVFKCNLCQLERFTQNAIEVHVEIFHKGMCKICSAYFPIFEDLATHVEEKHCNEESSSSDSELKMNFKHSLENQKGFLG